jgi:hypothetical protein
MVRKFMLWKTNKEAVGDEFPAYVVHFTDFSPNRKDALAREVRVSSSAEQIQQLYGALKDENIKAGWQLKGGLLLPTAAAAVAPDLTPAPASVAEEKPTKKKAAAKKPAAAQEPTAPQPESPMAPSERVKKPRKKKSG